jgi:hypothetical protein
VFSSPPLLGLLEFLPLRPIMGAKIAIARILVVLNYIASALRVANTAKTVIVMDAAITLRMNRYARRLYLLF